MTGVSLSSPPVPSETPVRAVCFYLPQFHPIQENNDWWCPGFTEWTNVTRAVPLFPGHYQPHRPADLGYYDLRLEETRIAQAALAAQYGISAFCYYHYWFNGRLLLDTPLKAVVRSGRPAFPFLVCWANENWTRRWDGLEHEVLIAQDYSAEDDLAHIRHLAETISDSRYVRLNGRALLLVYRASALPHPQRTADIWRSEALRLGLGELHLGRVEDGWTGFSDPAESGFDSAVEFQPRFGDLPRPMSESRVNQMMSRMGLRRRRYPTEALIHDYATVMNHMMAKPLPPYSRFPCVTPGWDNTARRGTRATVFTDSTPQLYGKWLSHACSVAAQRPSGERLVFINAWNEWAEGAHLEPDERFGHQYLQVTKEVLQESNAHLPEVRSA
jgi:lipopolysaccharide biosynthesis protein